MSNAMHELQPSIDNDCYILLQWGILDLNQFSDFILIRFL